MQETGLSVTGSMRNDVDGSNGVLVDPTCSLLLVVLLVMVIASLEVGRARNPRKTTVRHRGSFVMESTVAICT